MAEDPRNDDQLMQPHDVDAPDGTRGDGRPTGADEGTLAAGRTVEEVPTVAPEEEGATPATEHAPGADL